MSVPDAGYCSGCGRQLGLEPVGGEVGELRCPLCHDALAEFRDGPGALFDCSLCGGQFVEHALLHDLLARHEHPSVGEDHDRHALRPHARTTAYIPCPACSALMNRKNFGLSSGIVVDVCKKHGTWFDLGELPRVLAFAASGGMEHARKRAAEAQAQARHEGAVASAAVLSLSEPPSSFDAAAAFARSLIDLLLH